MTAVFTGMFDGVPAAVALPGILAVVLTIIAEIIQARDVKRRDPVRRFTLRGILMPMCQRYLAGTPCPFLEKGHRVAVRCVA